MNFGLRVDIKKSDGVVILSYEFRGKLATNNLAKNTVQRILQFQY
jgi:hypothetical protein